MNTTAPRSTAERLGRRLANGWRAYVRGERRASNWLVRQGLPEGVAGIVLWMAKLVMLGLLLYVAFWPAAVALLCLVVVGRVLDQGGLTDDGFELQYPTIEELRKSPGYDPNLYNDTSHEMYHDD